MAIFRIILGPLLVAALLAVAPATFARELTNAEKATLAETVADFDTAMREKDVEAITSVVPPKFIDQLAKQNGLTTDALIVELAKVTEQALASVTFESFDMDLDGATYKETPDGQPYALIPTTTVMDMGTSGKVKASSQTFALLDEGDWYLIRTDDRSTLAVVTELYPSYAAEDFPIGTTEPVTP